MAQLTIKLVNTLRARANGGPLLPAGLALNVNFPNAPTAATPFAFSRHGTMPPPTAAVSLRSPTRTTYAPAAFRLLADDGSRVVDLWAYRD
ncbi:hypothetical protein [Cupriavidus sp. amp6]|uniref:hypothetical protein n=1 Tax=Cupriavidus sp. amp6 TaxID=388051 RepID=UPI001E62B09D|nr:hypothetical protein [Cupriavidus sp. amp6]